MSAKADLDFRSLDLAEFERVVAETAGLVKLNFTAGSRTLFGGIKARLADFKSSKTAPAFPCPKCGAAKVAPASPCGVCADKPAVARGARQRPLNPAPATLSRSAFDKLTARQKSAHCLGGGKLTN